jgi:hypothetical protein
VPYAAALNPSVFTVEAWAYPTGGAGSFRSVFTSRDTPTRGFALYASDANTWQLWLGTGSSYVHLDGPAVALNAWTHLVATYNGTTASLYVNGVLVASENLAYAPNTVRPFRIGAGQTETSAGLLFSGRLDEIAVYNTALTAAEVTTNYQTAQTVSPPSGGGGGGGGGGVPDLKVSLSASTTTPATGGESDLVATVTNTGTQTSTGTHLVITLPSTMTLLGPPVFDRGSGCTGNQAVDCNLDFLPVGVATKVVFAVRVNSQGTITAVASGDREANPSDNTATATITPSIANPAAPAPTTAPKLTQRRPASATPLHASRSGALAAVSTIVTVNQPATVTLIVRDPRTGKLLILQPGSKLATTTLEKPAAMTRTTITAPRSFTLKALLQSRRLARGAVYQLGLTATNSKGKTSKLQIRFLGT